MESYSINTSVRGYHVYKDVWEAALGQLLPCHREPGNIHDSYAVAVVETGEDRLQFRGENFHELASNPEIREGFLPRKFPLYGISREIHPCHAHVHA